MSEEVRETFRATSAEFGYFIKEAPSSDVSVLLRARYTNCEGDDETKIVLLHCASVEMDQDQSFKSEELKLSQAYADEAL